jgi:hypothetical protein
MFVGSRAWPVPPSLSRLHREFAILDISQAYRPPRPVTLFTSLVNTAGYEIRKMPVQNIITKRTIHQFHVLFPPISQTTITVTQYVYVRYILILSARINRHLIIVLNGLRATET